MAGVDSSEGTVHKRAFCISRQLFPPPNIPIYCSQYLHKKPPLSREAWFILPKPFSLFLMYVSRFFHEQEDPTAFGNVFALCVVVCVVMYFAYAKQDWAHGRLSSARGSYRVLLSVCLYALPGVVLLSGTLPLYRLHRSVAETNDVFAQYRRGVEEEADLICLTATVPLQFTPDVASMEEIARLHSSLYEWASLMRLGIPDSTAVLAFTAMAIPVVVLLFSSSCRLLSERANKCTFGLLAGSAVFVVFAHSVLSAQSSSLLYNCHTYVALTQRAGVSAQRYYEVESAAVGALLQKMPLGDPLAPYHAEVEKAVKTVHTLWTGLADRTVAAKTVASTAVVLCGSEGSSAVSSLALSSDLLFLSLGAVLLAMTAIGVECPNEEEKTKDPDLYCQ